METEWRWSAHEATRVVVVSNREGNIAHEGQSIIVRMLLKSILRKWNMRVCTGLRQLGECSSGGPLRCSVKEGKYFEHEND
jgi:hypothetical protein